MNGGDASRSEPTASLRTLRSHTSMDSEKEILAVEYTDNHLTSFINQLQRTADTQTSMYLQFREGQVTRVRLEWSQPLIMIATNLGPFMSYCVRFGRATEPGCRLCSNDIVESRYQLYFECPGITARSQEATDMT